MVSAREDAIQLDSFLFKESLKLDRPSFSEAVSASLCSDSPEIH